MTPGRLLLALALLAAPAAGELEVTAAPGQPDPWLIRVNGFGATALEAVSRIALHLGWRLQAAPEDRERLAQLLLTLEVEARHAQTVVELIAVSAGMAATFVPEAKAIRVFGEPDPLTPAGRKELRRRAVGAYRDAILKAEDLDHSLALKGRLGELLMSPEEADYGGAYANWRDILDQCQEAPPTGDLVPRALLNAGLCKERLGETAAAQECYRQVVEHYRQGAQFLPALLGQARCLYALDRVDRGLDSLLLYLRDRRYFHRHIGPEGESRLRLAIAEGFFQAGKHDSCREVLAAVLERRDLPPEDLARALYLAGASALRAGRPAEAAASLNRLLREHPEPAWGAAAFLDLAEALAATGRYLEALAAAARLESAALAPPERRRQALVMAGCERLLGRSEQAVALLRQALESLGGVGREPQLALALADTYFQGGSVERARQICAELLARPEAAGTDRLLDQARVRLVGCLVHQNLREEAAAVARRELLRVADRDAFRELHRLLLESLIGLGRLEEAAALGGGGS